jgi:hypothetical protein
MAMGSEAGTGDERQEEKVGVTGRVGAPVDWADRRCMM